MLCQRCRKQPATVSVALHINGLVSSVHLCEQCARIVAHTVPHPNRELWAMPPDAEQSIRARRKVNELHAQMKSAVEHENYEEAARIRDALSKIECEVHNCE